ncbi:hypothetical protein PRK78_005410 [Emydomyces testavorans]|uniref:Uncharacterized protein n=1 Tax=Emydomyces testavorans TaxID=2070801 RepID=A0AAF0DK69_9EURO|nr:hypothetical protein PRK78_005410 [Emydomyces testavorans]
MAPSKPQKLSRRSLELLEQSPIPEPKPQDSYAAAIVREEQFHSYYQQKGMALLDEKGDMAHGPRLHLEGHYYSPPGQSWSELADTARQLPSSSAKLDNDLKQVRAFARATNEDPVKRYLTPGCMADPFIVAKANLSSLQMHYASAESVKNRNLIAQLNFDGIRQQSRKRKRSNSLDMVVETDDSNQGADAAHQLQEGYVYTALSVKERC